MNEETSIVEILGSTAGKAGSNLNFVFDQQTGTYKGLAYTVADDEVDKEFKRLHPDQKVAGFNYIIAIIDTGVLSEHPGIKPYLAEIVDFTGEGPEDLNGHGTMVALVALRKSPIGKIMSVKALDASGYGTEERLIQAIEWSVEHGAKIINISAGIYRKKWNSPECCGDCKLCKAAENAAQKGIFVLAAAGNKHGQTCCPANIGFLKPESDVIAISATDLEGRPLANTGYGTVAAVGEFLFGPLPPQGDADRLAFFIDTGIALRANGRSRDAERDFKSALELADQYASEDQKMTILQNLGSITIEHEEYQDAHTYYTSLIKIASLAKNANLESKGWHQIGLIASRIPDLEKADQYYRRSLEISDQAGDALQAAITCNQLAITAQQKGRLTDANLWINQALAYKNIPIEYEATFRYNLAVFLFTLWNQYHFEPHLNEARSSAERSLAIKETIPNSDIWSPLHLLANISKRENHDDEARKYLWRARETFASSRRNSDALQQKYDKLIGAISAMVNGDSSAQSVLEKQYLEMAKVEDWQGMPAAIQRLCAGERDWAALVEDLGIEPALLIKIMLDMLI